MDKILIRAVEFFFFKAVLRVMLLYPDDRIIIPQL